MPFFFCIYGLNCEYFFKSWLIPHCVTSLLDNDQVLFNTIYLCTMCVACRNLSPLAAASCAPWRWRSSPARPLPWRRLRPGPVCRWRQRTSWRTAGWCSRSSLSRSRCPPPRRRHLPAGSGSAAVRVETESPTVGPDDNESREKKKTTSTSLRDEVWAEHDGILKLAALMRDTFLQKKQGFQVVLAVSSWGVNLTRWPSADCDLKRQHQRFHQGAAALPSVWKTVSGVVRKWNETNKIYSSNREAADGSAPQQKISVIAPQSSLSLDHFSINFWGEDIKQDGKSSNTGKCRLVTIILLFLWQFNCRLTLSWCRSWCRQRSAELWWHRNHFLCWEFHVNSSCFSAWWAAGFSANFPRATGRELKLSRPLVAVGGRTCKFKSHVCKGPMQWPLVTATMLPISKIIPPPTHTLFHYEFILFFWKCWSPFNLWIFLLY